MIIHLIVGLIKKILYKRSQHFPKPYEPFGGDINAKVDLFNYATNADLKNATAIHTSKLGAKSDLASLKAEVDEIDIDKLNTDPDDLRNLKSKVDKLNIDKLAPVPVDLSKLSNVVKTDVVKKNAYKAKIKNIEDKMPDITNLATKTALNAKTNEVEWKIPSINSLAATTTVLAAVEHKIGNISKDFSVDNMKKAGLNGYVYDFSVDYNAISVADVFDIHKYLMKKNRIV